MAASCSTYIRDMPTNLHGRREGEREEGLNESWKGRWEGAGRTYHSETPLAAAEAVMEEKAVAVIISQHKKSC